MEVDSDRQQEVKALPKYAFALISLIRTEQGQNGVKHGDYKRYRKHCRNKLQALYKTLKFQHGRTKYIKRKIDPGTISDARFLQIPLFSAERAYAYAMELKKEIEAHMDIQKRNHMLGRLRKAASWARDVARLCAIRCEPRGVVEAEAYAAFISGIHLVERAQQGDFQQSLALLTRSRHILSKLSGLGGSAEAQALYLQQAEEMEPSIRFCKYQLSRQGVAAADNEDQLLAAAQKIENVLPANELSTYMQALAKEAQVQLAAQGVAAGSDLVLEWQGRKLSVKPDRLKAAISHMQTLAAQLDSSAAAAASGNAMDVEGAASSEAYHQQCSMYNKVLKALVDARAAAAHAIKSSNVPEGDASHTELVGIETALTSMSAARQVELAELQAQHTEDRFRQTLERTAVATGASKKVSKDKDRRDGVKAEDVIRTLDALSRSLAELADIGARSGGRSGEAMYDEATAKSTCVRASRAYYTAHHLLSLGKPLEAYAVFVRAGERAQQAAPDAPGQKYKAYVDSIAQKAAIYKSVAQAEHAAAAASQREGVESGLGGLGLAEQQAAQQQGAKWMSQALDTWESFAVQGKQAHVYQLPFPMQPIPCRPIMLDTAANHVVYPDLEHRLPKKTEKKTILGSLGLTGWGGWGSAKK